MALTLTSTISATDRIIEVTGTVPDDIEAGYEFRLDDERLVLTTFALHEVQYPGWTQQDPNRNSWMVRRGVAASHNAGTTVKGAVDAFVSAATETPPTPFASSGGDGGSLSATDGTTTVDPVSSLVFPPGTLVDEGAAVAAYTGGFVASDLDPGAIGTGGVWKDTALGVGVDARWWERNAANDGWDASALMTVVVTGDVPAGGGATIASEDGTADARCDASAIGDGIANAVTNAQTFGSGAATSGSRATAFGSGPADAGSMASTITGTAYNYLLCDRNGTQAGLNVEVGPGGPVVTVLGLPTADPVVAGALWIDVAGGRVLKVSAG